MMMTSLTPFGSRFFNAFSSVTTGVNAVTEFIQSGAIDMLTELQYTEAISFDYARITPKHST
jgi:hypothetical protein